jgi:tetratricopeptide (TPR) repeat protein
MMMKTKIILFLTGCLLFFSCSEDFITKDFDKSRYVPGSFFNTKDHAEQALNAAYAGLNGWANGYTWDVGIMHFVQGDDLYETGYAAGFGTWGQVSNFDLTNTYSQYSSVWDSYYRNILACNVALEVMPQAQEEADDPNFTTAILNNWMGQAYFLRAFFYYNLYQYYPDDKIVIRRTQPESAEDFEKAPSPSDSTFRFIESDLQKAETLLTNGLNVTADYEKGRVTRGAAAALLGKLYLYRGMYTEAAAEFKKILPGVGDAAYGTYSLVDSYRDNFTRDGENNTESVFEIQFTDLNQGGAWSNNDVNWVFQNFTLNRTSWAIMWWNFAVPNFKLDDFESWTEDISGTPTTVYDYRVYETFWGVPNGANFTENGVEKDWIEQGWADETVAGIQGVYSIRKYAVDNSDDHPAGLDPLWSDMNIRIIRLADVMLLYAECLANLNPGNLTASDPNSAVYWVDMVRERANNPMNDQAHLYSARPGVYGQLPTATALMTANSWSLMELIEHERYAEGYCEGWWKEDIKRWKKGASYKNITAHKPLWNGWESLILPVPQSELDRNPNMN